MIKEIIMPKLGQTVEEATVEKWIKKEGDKVEKGEVLLEIVTDKATLEVESFDKGYLRKILIREGETVPVLTVIGYIADSMEEKIPEKKEEKPSHPEEKTAPVQEEKETVGKTEPAREGRLKASPLAKKLAKEMGIDLATIKGSGPGGRIVREDVLAQGKAKPEAVAQPKTQPELVVTKETQSIPLSTIRKSIAESMTSSKQQIPHFYLSCEIDMTESIKLRKDLVEEFEKKGLPKVAFDDLLIKAAACALHAHPQINRIFAGDSLRILSSADIALAVSLEEGLIVPVIHSAEKLSLEEIAKNRDDLASRARNKKLNPDECKGGTLTISNLGMYPISAFIAVIPPGQMGILAAGTIIQKPVAVEGSLIVRSVMNVTGSFDHRAVDGAYAAAFLQEFKNSLEHPYKLLL